MLTLVLAACNASSEVDCAKEEGLVGLSTFASTTIAPGETLEVASFGPICNGQCPVTAHRWQLQPDGTASGVVRVTYGSHCGPSSGQISNDEIGNCTLSLQGASVVTDASLAESSDADCVALWAGVKPDDPANTTPCSEGSSNDFAPFATFFNNSNVPITLTGPGPANNPTASCSYASTP